jgi:hypothetical protein
MAVAFIALLAALGGTAVALPGKNGVKKDDIARNAVSSSDIKNNSVTSTDVRNSTIRGRDVRSNTLTGSDIAESRLAKVPTAGVADNAGRAGSAGAVDGRQRIGFRKVTATDGATEAAARSAAPEITLATIGPFTVYGKCFTDLSVPDTNAETFVKTSLGGSILDSDEDNLDGSPVFLEPGTAETDRQANLQDTPANTSAIYLMHSTEIGVQGADGTAFEARVGIGVKNGTLPGGNGLYGAGNVCTFAGQVDQF